MLNIKKYANGRFFDTINKKYIKPDQLAEMIQKGEKIKVTLTKTGKDITKSVIEQFSKKEEAKGKKEKDKKEVPFLKTDKLKKWVGEVIDAKIGQVMDIVKLPSRDQIAKLDKNIKALNKKIEELNLSVQKEDEKKEAETGAEKAEKAKAVVKEAEPEEEMKKGGEKAADEKKQ